MSLRPEAPSWNKNSNADGENHTSNKANTASSSSVEGQNTKSDKQQQQQQQQQFTGPITEAKLFVGQIPYECDESRLRELFEAYGRVKQIHILQDAVSNGLDPRKARQVPNGKGRAAFVTYETTQEADCAIFTLHNRYRMLTNRPLQVSYAKNSPNISLFGKQAAIEVAMLNKSNPMPE